MIEIRTKFNENVTKELNKMQMKKLWWLYAFFTLIFVLFGVMCGIDKEEGSWIAGGILIAVGVLFFPLCFLLTKILQKNMNKSMSVMSEETLETYKFDENRISIEQTKGNSYHGLTETDYSYLFSVKETKDYWFLYISKMQTHVVPKNNIITGSVEELNEIFKAKLGVKFKAYVKK